MTSVRVWARFTIPFMLVAAVFAGLGISHLMQQRTVVRAVAILLGILILFEGWLVPYANFTRVSDNHRQVDTWLADAPDGTTLIEYPLPNVNKNALYSQSLHGQTIVNGYMSLLPSFYQEASLQLGTWPDQEAVELLRAWGVKYMVLSSPSSFAEFDEQILPATQTLPGVCLVEAFEDGFMEMDVTYLFEIRQASAPCESSSSISLRQGRKQQTQAPNNTLFATPLIPDPR